jgi:hypothetical protein
MLITRYLDEPCPKCGVKGKYGNVNVGMNILNRGCNNCGEWVRLPLPDIRKKVIYLDQFFLSHAFREQEQPFVDAASRLKDMAARQLIVCPYSSVHTDETHLWRHEQQEELYKFIKQTARGYEFNQAYDIKQTQMHRAFDAFRSGDDIFQEINERDAFRADIHSWDDYFWIDIRPFLGDLEAMRQGKAAAISGLVDLFPEWAKLTTRFDEDVNMEARGYGRSLLNQYLQMVVNVGTRNLMSYMEAPMDTMYVESLLHCDSSTMEIDQRLKRIGAFFSSPYFTNIPNVRISCGLFAILRKMVKKGAYTNPDKARRKLSGLFFDSECISVYGPYSDGIFIDRAMKQWCEDPEARLLEPYDTMVFSVASWNDFHDYLNRIEENYTEEVREAINWVYPGVYA